jgi:hypothetical protein
MPRLEKVEPTNFICRSAEHGHAYDTWRRQASQNTVDAYVTAYWVYKHKLVFTTGDKLREVRPELLLLCSTMHNDDDIVDCCLFHSYYNV